MTDEITLDAPETRIERFLAAAAGVEGITLDEPETRIERYLYKIAQGGGSGENGNIFIVNATFAYDDVGDEWSVTLDKTFAEISAAANAGKIVLCIPYESESGATGYPCVMTVESTEAFANADVEAGNGAVYSFNFGIDNNDDTSVEATTWSKGGGGVLVVHDEDGTLDKTWQEIKDADFAVLKLTEQDSYDTFWAASVTVGTDKSGADIFSVYFVGRNTTNSYIASSADGYPSAE